MRSGQPAACPQTAGTVHPSSGQLVSHDRGWLVMERRGGNLLLACLLMLMSAQRVDCHAVKAWLTGCWAMLIYHCSIQFETCSAANFVRHKASLSQLNKMHSIISLEIRIACCLHQNMLNGLQACTCPSLTVSTLAEAEADDCAFREGK